MLHSTNEQVFRKYTIFLLLTKYLYRLDEMASWVSLARRP